MVCGWQTTVIKGFHVNLTLIFIEAVDGTKTCGLYIGYIKMETMIHNIDIACT